MAVSVGTSHVIAPIQTNPNPIVKTATVTVPTTTKTPTTSQVIATSALAPAAGSGPGGLNWTAFKLPTGDTGYYTADPTSAGSYYYYGPDQVVYKDSYTGEVQSNQVATNKVGTVASLFGATTPASASTLLSTTKTTPIATTSTPVTSSPANTTPVMGGTSGVGALPIGVLSPSSSTTGTATPAPSPADASSTDPTTAALLDLLSGNTGQGDTGAGETTDPTYAAAPVIPGTASTVTTSSGSSSAVVLIILAAALIAGGYYVYEHYRKKQKADA